MLDHICIEVSNYERAKQFYLRALAPLGYSLLMEVSGFAGFGVIRPTGPLATLWIRQGNNSHHQTHIAFTANNRQIVDEFYNAALLAGAEDNGKPGIREVYHPNYYGAFVLDADGYNIEAVCHQPVVDKKLHSGVRPEDVLADGHDTAEFNGVTVRKGTIKAAIENVKIFESLTASPQEKQAAKNTIEDLAQNIMAIELHKYATWKNPEIQAIFDKLK